MADIGIKELLEAGVHFGHQTRRWNPKMRRFIFGERDGIYIIDLLQTDALLNNARRFAGDLSRRGGTVLFVGTKKQARDAVRDIATEADMPYVNHRWLGGLLTNFQTISLRIKRLHDLERYETEGQLQLLPTRERMAAQSDLEKLRANLGGVKNMQRVPDAMFVIDLKTEAIAVREAQRLRIPIIGLVDTNCDPDGIDFVIPGNDDAIRSCAAVTRAIGDVVSQGHNVFRAEEERARLERERQEAEERARREAEEQARREAEEKARAEEQARREAEEQAARERRAAGGSGRRAAAADPARGRRAGGSRGRRAARPHRPPRPEAPAAEPEAARRAARARARGGDARAPPCRARGGACRRAAEPGPSAAAGAEAPPRRAGRGGPPSHADVRRRSRPTRRTVMSAVSAKDVKELRDRTGAGMLACRDALKEADGDIDKAVEILRAKGEASAAKRSGAEASRRRDPELHPRQQQDRRARRGRLPDRLRGPQREVRRVRARRGPARGRGARASSPSTTTRCPPRIASARSGSPPSRLPTVPRTCASASSRASWTSGSTRWCCCARSTSTRTSTAARRSRSSGWRCRRRRGRTSSSAASRGSPSAAEVVSGVVRAEGL